MSPAADPKANECHWFLLCRNPADKDVSHPTLGWVLTCDEHIAWLGQAPSPTQLVPPMSAAAYLRRPSLARLMLDQAEAD